MSWSKGFLQDMAIELAKELMLTMVFITAKQNSLPLSKSTNSSSSMPSLLGADHVRSLLLTSSSQFIYLLYFPSTPLILRQWPESPNSPIADQKLTSSTHRFSEEFPDVHFTKIDVDDVPDVAQELGIRAMPTFLIFKGEEKVSEVVGANHKALQAAIQKVVDAEKGEAKSTLR